MGRASTVDKKLLAKDNSVILKFLVGDGYEDSDTRLRDLVV
jgi:hypothetical protein